MSERVDYFESRDAGPSSEQSLGSLVAGASKELSNLVRSEVELAKLELTATAKRAGVGGGLLGGAGFLAALGVIFISVALVYGLYALGLPLGVAFLLVGLAYLFLAALLALLARSQLKRLRPPARTIRTVRDDIDWAKNPTVAPPSRLGSAGSPS